jgi:hypothetical protein
MLLILQQEYLEEENGDMNARVSPASQKGAQAPPFISIRDLKTDKLGATLLQLVGTCITSPGLCRVSRARLETATSL